MNKLRLAGDALKWLFSKPGVSKGAPSQLLNAGELAMRLVPDVGFAALTAAQTPGDVFDKAVAGGAQLIGGTGVGLAAGRLGGRNQAVSGLLDMGGSVLGDYAAMPVSDTIQRAKDKLVGGEGQTAWERMGAEQQTAYANELKQQILAQYGLVPGTREQYAMSPDPTMSVIGG